MTASIEYPSSVPGARLTDYFLTRLHSVVNSEENPVKYLSIDPGTDNGICGYDKKYYLMFMFTIHFDDMTMFIHSFEKVDTCIIEDYRVYAHKAKAHINSDLKTTRVIGKVEDWATLKRVKLVKQMPAIKPEAYKWINENPLPKSNRLNHAKDAHVHFMHWAIRTMRIAPTA